MMSSTTNPINTVTAIVPAYNESKHIKKVLVALSGASCIDEIIVIDDGSSDYTGDIARSVDGVRVFTNERNIGKASSMDRGVKESQSNIIFFCDGDLDGFKSEHAEDIIKPVLEGSTDMSIGLRSNVAQQAVHLFAINSGERALKKEMWLSLPGFFKHRYRVEAGLNYHIKKNGRGFVEQTYPYMQTLKEKKYGIIKGVVLRAWMYWDVGIAYMAAVLNRVKLIKLK